jgi:hypothetical protein
MVEKRYKYAAKIKQPQTVVSVKLDPKGGFLSERAYKTVKKDAYGASLLEKGLLVVEELAAEAAYDGAVPDDDGSSGVGKSASRRK